MSFLGAEPCNYVTARVLWNTTLSRFHRAWGQERIENSLQAPRGESLQYAEGDLQAKRYVPWTCKLQSPLNPEALIWWIEAVTFVDTFLFTNHSRHSTVIHWSVHGMSLCRPRPCCIRLLPRVTKASLFQHCVLPPLHCTVNLFPNPRQGWKVLILWLA